MLEERVIPDENNPYYLTFCLLRAMLRANGVAIAHIRLVKRTRDGEWATGCIGMQVLLIYDSGKEDRFRILDEDPLALTGAILRIVDRSEVKFDG